MLLKRRDFIHHAAIASASLLLPKFLNATRLPNTLQAEQKILVVIQLTGGNDGLNTVIPYTNDLYYQNRPQIAIPKRQALRITDDAGLNPHLPVLKSLYEEGHLAVINNVGYPSPNRSHFRSMDIWQTASDANEYLSTGWLGRYLEQQPNNDILPTHVIETDDILSLALKGEHKQGFALHDPRKLYSPEQEQFYRYMAQSHAHEHELVNYLYKTLGDTVNSTDYILEKIRTNPSQTDYPSTAFGKHLKSIASLIRSDISTRAYYVSLGSFDTHVRQLDKQTNLFDQLNHGLRAFTNDLKQSNRFNDVLIMTFSEFGRRVAENASAGTDHGTANTMFFIGGALKQKGIINALPDLSDLQDGDLQYQVDFKDVYATVIDRWLNGSVPDILGKSYKPMDFL